ncbi:MAG: zf-HC2 domain-containing protein [Candidatus Kuenenia sp.]|uniref:anti-sigma factor family protein n=1 Tax=Candidatus Kuenenia sp. TaxID=2499824 RepID=UPI0022BD45F7|nr:zf-HC2 domain-containing protein [Candidatus Kuenenia sp.]MCZ7622832.1 zf-HC2 domain-containing protein [Candidatus Kuenenia sp.]
MNCTDVRKYFYAFLDNELDVERNIEVLSHINMCHACGVKIERERLLQERVKETVCKIKVPAYLEQKIFRSAESRPNFFAQFIKNFSLRDRFVLVSGIATAIVLIACFFVIQNKLKKDNIFYLTESKYHDYIMKQLVPDIRLQNAGEIIGRLQNRTGLSVILPGIEENMQIQNAKAIVDYFQKQTGLTVTLPFMKGNVQLVGASLTNINGKNVPLVFYMLDDTPITLAVVCNSDITFRKMKEIVADKMVVYTPCSGKKLLKSNLANTYKH